ncbi:MAG TPA: DUF6537 domain-containing protein, partial [Actinospica sp.]|nr:DUF6537 domain-containing protein [Actinospica sp.]
TPAERVMINERVCEGCGDCGRKSNCLSVQPVPTEFGRKTQIDQSSCNLDFSCLDGDCPSFLTVIGGKPGNGSGAARQIAPPLDTAAIPAPHSPEHKAAAGPHVTRITGVGGTGVVTLSQILSTAALLAGRQVKALDQTGLAQKGGAVVSDVKIADTELQLAGKAAAGECDLYLGCDILVAADPKNLAAADRDRTVAVVSTTEVPTGAMVIDTSASFPDSGEITERIRLRSRAADAVFLDARRLAETLLGEDQFANILLTGAAFQAGALPLPAEAIEKAITLNGVRVDANLQAFRRGRQAVADPAAFAATLAALEPPSPAAPEPAGATAVASVVAAADGSELARIVALRTADLIGYQDAGYARRYAEQVERVRRAEAERVPGGGELAEAVARYLYKLMAYKDEYEVARLSLDPAVAANVRSRFGAGARMSYRLHPPVLRALGARKKLTLGPWFRPVFGVLVRMRRLRGTRLDPFGYTSVRRTERELIAEYARLIGDLLATLSPGNHALAVQLASLPDEVRGYEQVKLDNVTRYRERLAELRTAYARQAEPVKDSRS